MISTASIWPIYIMKWPDEFLYFPVFDDAIMFIFRAVQPTVASFEISKHFLRYGIDPAYGIRNHIEVSWYSKCFYRYADSSEDSIPEKSFQNI